MKMKRFSTLLLLVIIISTSPYAMAAINAPELKLSSWKEGETIISWNLIEGTSYYNIYGGDTPASATVNPINKIASTSIQFYIDENKQNLHAYYVITAISKDSIESPGSNIISLIAKIMMLQHSGTTEHLTNIIFHNNIFVAIGNGGTILTSPDGIVWTKQISNTIDSLRNIIYADNKFIITGYQDTILTSSDGITWTKRMYEGEGYLVNKIIFANNTFVFMKTNDEVHTTPDLISSWAMQNIGEINVYLSDLTYGNGKFVIIGDKGTILTSTDAISWTQQDSGTTIELQKIIFADNKFIILTKGGLILTSPDTIHWNKQTTESDNLFSITFGSGKFVATGSMGIILTSTDGITWTKQVSRTNYYLYKVVYANGQFITIGMRGTILTSPNGITWTKQASQTTKDLVEVAFGNGKFVTVGWDGTILTSP